MSDIQEQISILVEVQAVDEEILQADRQIAALDDEAVSLEQEVAARETLVTSEKKDLEDLKKSYREREAEFKLNTDLIDKSNVKLRAVKTNKEYQSILKAIEDIQKKNSDLEDRMITLLDEIETVEAAIREKETQLAAFIQSSREKKETIAASVRREQETVESLNRKKAQISAKADPQVITILDEVKKKVRGMAVAPVQQEICMGCHMNIPPQLFNELQRFDELRFCPHCQRIIYWKAKENE
jgi:hypothetical protein